jgi:hypothetical protein
LVFRDLFAYEREADHSLVVGAGIPDHWLDAGEVAVTGLPTGYGTLDLRLSRTPDGGLALLLGGDLRLPPGGIRFAPPLREGSSYQVSVNGLAADAPEQHEVLVSVLPARVVLCP